VNADAFVARVATLPPATKRLVRAMADAWPEDEADPEEVLRAGLALPASHAGELRLMAAAALTNLLGARVRYALATEPAPVAPRSVRDPRRRRRVS
jgi:hypothetical protein